MPRRLAPLFSLLLALGCGSPTAVQEPFSLGDPFWIPLGETAVERNGGAVVRFARVIENSTCPINAVCVWAGRTVVEVGVTVPPGAEQLFEIELTSYDAAERARTVNGYRVELLGFRPPNRIGTPPARPDLQLVVVGIR